MHLSVQRKRSAPGSFLRVTLSGTDTAACLARAGTDVVHPREVGTHWELPRPAARLLMAGSVGHVLPSISRTARGLGLTATSSPGLLEVVDPRGGRGTDRLLQRLARELTGAETEAVRVVTDPPGSGPALSARLLAAPTLAVELAR